MSGSFARRLGDERGELGIGAGDAFVVDRARRFDDQQRVFVPEKSRDLRRGRSRRIARSATMRIAADSCFAACSMAAKSFMPKQRHDVGVAQERIVTCRPRGS